MSAADALRALREEAYCRVVRCFLAGEYSMQKEAMLSRLRGELAIPPARHAALRDAVERGVDSPWLTGGGGGGGGSGPPSASGGARGGGGARARGGGSGGAAAAVADALPGVDALVGHRVKRYWPEHGGWFDGVLTDYNAATREHW